MSTLYNSTYNVGAYHTDGRYNANAYTFQMIVELNQQYDDLRDNITINWYATANSPFSYSNFNSVGVYLDLKVRGVTRRVYSGIRSKLDTGVKTLIATYTGDVLANDDGSLTIDVIGLFDGGESVNFLPRKHTKDTGNIVVPSISVNPKPYFKLVGVWKKSIRQFLKLAGHYHLVKRTFVKKNGHWVRSK